MKYFLLFGRIRKALYAIYSLIIIKVCTARKTFPLIGKESPTHLYLKKVQWFVLQEPLIVVPGYVRRHQPMAFEAQAYEQHC